MLRVVPGQHPRPLLVDGFAPVRHQNTTHPADWQRLRDLFTEPGPGVYEDAWNIHAPDIPRRADGTSDPTVDFVIRTGLGFTVSREAKWRPLSEATVIALIDALNQSPLHQVLRRHSLGVTYGGEAWLGQIVLDAGLLGMEQLARNLRLENAVTAP